MEWIFELIIYFDCQSILLTSDMFISWVYSKFMLDKNGMKNVIEDVELKLMMG